MASARGDGGGEEEEEDDDDDVPHVRDPCHHAMCCVVCKEKQASYQVPLLGRLGESEEERCSRWRRRPPSLLACLACSGVTCEWFRRRYGPMEDRIRFGFGYLIRRGRWDTVSY